MWRKFRALDLFCGAGGATRGLQQAGFQVAGVDIRDQPRYCGDRFYRADALEFADRLTTNRYDFIWASPPCQAYSPSSPLEKRNARAYPDLIAPVRALLERSGVAYCIENVPQAPLRPTLTLDGWMFPELRVVRKRIFELNFFILAPLSCPPLGLIRRGYSCVVGGGRPSGVGVEAKAWHTEAAKRKAMGVDWMVRHELNQAVPPAYSRFIGREAIEFLSSPTVRVSR